VGFKRISIPIPWKVIGNFKGWMGGMGVPNAKNFKRKSKAKLEYFQEVSGREVKLKKPSVGG